MGCQEDLNECCDCCECLDAPERWVCCPIFSVVGFGLFLLVVLLPLSLKRVDFDETGILYSKVSRTLHTPVLREGLHDVGPDGEIIKLKRTQRQGYIPNMTTLTSDGLIVQVDIDVLYSIDPARSFYIIQEHTDQLSHDRFIMSMAETVVRDVISEFTARSFFLQRQEVQKEMETLLSNRFINASADAIMEAVQLSNVDFTTAVATALELSTIIQQDIENAKAERATQENAADVRRQLARVEAELTLLASQLQVRTRDLQATQDAAATGASLRARSYAFTNISNYFDYGSSFFIQGYLKSLLLRLNAGRTIVGLDDVL